MSVAIGYELNGQFHPCRTDKETLIESLKGLGTEHPTALGRLVEEYRYDFQGKGADLAASGFLGRTENTGALEVVLQVQGVRDR